MTTKSKVIKTGGVVLLMAYAACILLGQVGSPLLLIYASLLVSTFWWNRDEIYIPLAFAGAIPVFEFIWIGYKTNWFDVDKFLPTLKTTSPFFQSGGYLGYAFWCIAIPFGFYKIYKIWMENK
ncbi:MAG: hypothetical protein NTV03_00490 [Candidatus Nomurabacteria bacterium]|nr:hypothetical protein [Candidatus Nomurabacteria bacterium]